METLESLSDALETTSDIRSIVRTMKALSAVSIRQCEQAEAALAHSERTVELALMAVLGERRDRGLPLPETGGGGAAAVIVIGSDRGLCGRYNETVTRFADRALGAAPAFLAVLGVRAAARLETAGRPADRLFALPGSAAGMTQTVQAVITEIDRWRGAHGIGRVRVIHNRRRGRANAVAVARELLPIPDAYLRDLAARDWPARGLPQFRMERGRLLAWLVQQRLFVVLYRALAEALASEHATRLAAMQSAERSIDERRDALTAAYRRRRQETITRELLDVIAGFEAVRGADD